LTGRDGIVECPNNTFSIGAADNCTPCSPGSHSQPGSSTCEKCSTGKYFNEIANACGTCPKNTFTLSGATDISGCTPCQNAGEYAKPGSGYCEKCSTGEYYDETANVCGICPRNTYTLSGAIVIDGCTPCQNTGEFVKPGSGYCEKCPQYEEFHDLTEGCASMTSFERIGGTCTCKVGETLMGTSCSPCELGKWKNESGVTSCARCEDTLKGAITEFEGSISQSSCICPMGYYDGGKGECVNIKEGMDNEVVGMKLESMCLGPGFWRTNEKSEDVRECPIPDTCVGGNETEICREGHKGH